MLSYIGLGSVVAGQLPPPHESLTTITSSVVAPPAGRAARGRPSPAPRSPRLGPAVLTIIMHIVQLRLIQWPQDENIGMPTVGAQSIARLYQNLVNCRRNISAYRRQKAAVFFNRKIFGRRMI
jgi:hypothetical protein